MASYVCSIIAKVRPCGIHSCTKCTCRLHQFFDSCLRLSINDSASSTIIEAVAFYKRDIIARTYFSRTCLAFNDDVIQIALL